MICLPRHMSSIVSSKNNGENGACRLILTTGFLDNDRLFIFSAIAYSKEKGGQRCAKLGMVVNSVHS